MLRRCYCLLIWLVVAAAVAERAMAELRVGAAVVDVTPMQLPVLVNGSMVSRSASRITTHVNARAIVLDDGRERVGLVVVDSCMMSRQLLDEAKQSAAARTGLRPDRILISATHTHTAPSSMGALGTDADPAYVPFLRQRIVESLVAAEGNLQAARVGWAAGDAAQFTALRRWVRRPDRIDLDPFGNRTVRANMHAARNLEDVIGPSGPEDPQLSLIAFESLAGKPLAVLCNFSMHYFGDKDISADYFGLFCQGLQDYLTESKHAEDGVVALMSHGCSGDIWRRDYWQPQTGAEGTIDDYAQGLLAIATGLYDAIEFQDQADLAMRELRLPMQYRVPDAQRLEWAQRIVDTLRQRLPKEQPEIYAREQVYLHRMQKTEVVVQALRIGHVAIATTPTETYALTGLKLKHQSPLERTMVIELANGGDGYIPPPEQHRLGGYNTWPARSAGLEVTAEPRIVAAGLSLLEQVCQAPRRAFHQSLGSRGSAMLAAQPIAYWRLDEFTGDLADSAVAPRMPAVYEPGVLFFLEGPQEFDFTRSEEINRCAHFAGGRLSCQSDDVTDEFSVHLACWNGMPDGVRDVAGWLFSRDYRDSTTARGLHLGLCGGGDEAGRLMLKIGDSDAVYGSTAIERWQWRQIIMVCQADRIRVYLSGVEQPEIDVARPSDSSGMTRPTTFFFGGRSDGESGWEGKLDEIAFFNRPLSHEEVRQLLAN